MGQNIGSSSFSPECYQLFADKVRQELDVLRQLISEKSFGGKENSVGAELEFYIVDKNGFPSATNADLLKVVGSELWQPELNKFNIEYNLNPTELAGSPFSHLEKDIEDAWAQMNQLAKPFDASLVPIGILPTLKESNFGMHSMTDIPRYRALADGLRAMRGGPFSIDIEGEEALHIEADDVTLEGANTSFQFHWRMPYDRFVDSFNAIQMITPLTVALSSNSPFMFHKSLWHETRVSLFKQSIDVRGKQDRPWREPARVDFGQGWLRQSPIELFQLAVSLYPPLLPELEAEDSEAIYSAGGIPKLPNLRLHHGTTWTWNRAVFDPHGEGHMRIELRSMPAGPTLQDMMANAAFSMGCAMSLTPSINKMISKLPFRYAEYNFYEAARRGIDAQLIWPDEYQVKLGERPVIEIISELLPQSMQALADAGIDTAEIDRVNQNLEKRLALKITGASWQTKIVNQFLQQNATIDEACANMFAIYREEQLKGKSIADWAQRI